MRAEIGESFRMEYDLQHGLGPLVQVRENHER